MYVAALLLNLFVSLLLVLYTLWFAREVFLQGKVPPFIRTRRPVALEVRDAFGRLPEGSVLYDLGCGDGRVLRAVAQANPQTSFVGVEIRTVPYVLARITQYRHPLPNVRYVQANLFKTDLSSATHVYTYLYPKVMDDLLPKLETELPSGARLISLDFPFTAKEPLQEIPLQSKRKRKLGSRLYAYQF